MAVSSRAGAGGPLGSGAAVRKAILAERDPERAEFLQRFFRTGPGEYAEGDRLLGLRMPVSRKIARRGRDIPLKDTVSLLHSEYHEVRMVALLILVDQYQRGDAPARQRIFDLYLANTVFVNNWDLVDASAHLIVGPHLDGGYTGRLDRLARSDLLWERRIAIIATLHFIRLGRMDETLRIASVLLHDDHDLIHKATGWMLREVGNRDRETEESFLRRYYSAMPRTMLRYAIEKFPEDLRQDYLRGRV